MEERLQRPEVESFGGRGQRWAGPNHLKMLNPSNETQMEPMDMAIPVQQVSGSRLILEPLSSSSADELCSRTQSEPDIFRYLQLDVTNATALQEWTTRTCQNMAKSSDIHYVMKLKRDGSIVGHTSVLGFKKADRRCEISWTWLFGVHRGQGYASESKQMLYAYLFRLGMKRVQMVADLRNSASMKSILRSGALQEGILRCNRRTVQGEWQNTAVFSIIDTDPEAIKLMA